MYNLVSFAEIAALRRDRRVRALRLRPRGVWPSSTAGRPHSSRTGRRTAPRWDFGPSRPPRWRARWPPPSPGRATRGARCCSEG